MKRKLLYSALLILALPMTVFALGMGDLKVDSYLNQPFKGEIELTNLGNTPLSGIQASVASYEDFDRIGFEYNEVLSLLKFKIMRNKKGQAVINIRSDERITEPYIELVMDVAWADGQLYRAYTVLLDPPDYTLATRGKRYPVVSKAQAGRRGVVDRPIQRDVVVQSPTGAKGHTESRYGPTTGKETIWSISQRYVSSDVNLPQIALAIVGANPQAFKDGNLNGLLAGKRLLIPATEQIRKIPPELATAEVVAHDRAWADKKPIDHVLKPPYFDGIEEKIPEQPEIAAPKSSHVPIIEAPEDVQVPDFIGEDTAETDKTDRADKNADSKVTGLPATEAEASSVSTMPSRGIFSYIENPDTILPAIAGSPAAKKEAPDPADKKETSTPVETVPAAAEGAAASPADSSDAAESDETLADKINRLQERNALLEKRMAQRDKEVEKLREQVKTLLAKPQGLAGQTATPAGEDDDGIAWGFLLLILLLVGAGVGGFLYLYSTRRTKAATEADEDEAQNLSPDTDEAQKEDQPRPDADDEAKGSSAPELSSEFDATTSDMASGSLRTQAFEAEKTRDSAHEKSDDEYGRTDFTAESESELESETVAKDSVETEDTLAGEEKTEEKHTQNIPADDEKPVTDEDVLFDDNQSEEVLPEDNQKDKTDDQTDISTTAPESDEEAIHKQSIGSQGESEQSAVKSEESETGTTAKPAERSRRPLQHLSTGLGMAAGTAAGDKSSEKEEHPSSEKGGDDDNKAQDSEEDNSLEFQTGLYDQTEEQSDETSDEAPETDDDNAIEFSTDSDEADEAAEAAEKGDDDGSADEKTSSESDESKEDNAIEFDADQEDKDAKADEEVSDDEDSGTEDSDDESVIEFDMADFESEADSADDLVETEETEVIASPVEWDKEQSDDEAEEAQLAESEKEKSAEITEETPEDKPEETDISDPSEGEGEKDSADEDEEDVNEFSLDELSAEDEALNEADEDQTDKEETSSEKDAKPAKENDLVKSKAALDTLLSLAETYVGMGDEEAARQSLDEVMEYGNKKQIKAAEKLLKQLDKKTGN